MLSMLYYVDDLPCCAMKGAGVREPLTNTRKGAITARMQSIMIGVNIYFTSAGMHSYLHANTFACYQDYV